MNRTRFVLRIAVVAALAVLAVAPAAWAQSRHHITVGLGYLKHLSEDLKDESMSVDFTNAAHALIGYRYSLTPQIDLTVDSHGTFAQDTYAGVDLSLMNSFFGPGVRAYMTPGGPRPYVQVNVFAVSESIEMEYMGMKVKDSKSGAGFGAAFGIDVPASRLISFPIQAHYL